MMDKIGEAVLASVIAKKLFDLRVEEFKLRLLAGQRAEATKLRDEALSAFYEMIAAAETEAHVILSRKR